MVVHVALSPVCQSPPVGVFSTSSMAFGNVGGTAPLIQVPCKLLCWAQKNGYTDSGPVRDQRTKRQCRGLPMKLGIQGFINHCFTPRGGKKKMVPVIWAVDCFIR